MFIQVYKAIFTSPSSARDISEEDDAENMPPAKSQRTLSGNKPVHHNVASKVHLNDKVTPQSIAYAAVQVGPTLLHVVLCLFAAASSISTCKLWVHGPNFMEDLTTKDCITILSISSKIPLDLQRRIMPKTYLTGGQCKYSLFLQRIVNYAVTTIGKSSQPLLLVINQTLLLLTKHSSGSMRLLNMRLPDLEPCSYFDD